MSRRRAALVVLLVAAACGPGPGAPRDLLIVSLDTVRQDHLPIHGYPRPTAPALEALARESVVFENAFAQATVTNPSHATIFTGVHPHVHGSRWNGQILASGRSTLAEILAERGFRTAAFVSGAPMRGSASGLDRGFQVYDDDFPQRRRDGRETTRRAVDWLVSQPPEQRRFLFVHLFDAHGPYWPRPAYAALFRSEQPGPRLARIPLYQRLSEESFAVHLQDYVDRYDANLRYLDARLAELLGAVDPERWVVVVLSDHGETLGERYHTLDHGAQVFDEQMRIPLVLRAPAIRPGRITAAVQTVDLLPTLLQLLAVEPPPGLELQGESLVPWLRGEPPRERMAFSSARAISGRHADRGYRLDPRRQILAVRSARWKLIRYPGLERDYLELYDLERDPGERSDVAALHPDVRDAHLQALESWIGREVPGGPGQLDPRLAEELRALGYVETE